MVPFRSIWPSRTARLHHDAGCFFRIAGRRGRREPGAVTGFHRDGHAGGQTLRIRRSAQRWSAQVASRADSLWGGSAIFLASWVPIGVLLLLAFIVPDSWL